MHGLRSSHVDNSNTSEQDTNLRIRVPPGDPLREIAGARALRELRRCAPGSLLPSEAELSARVRRQPGDGPAGARARARRGPRRRPPGLRLVRRHRAGAPAPGAPRHDRGPARGRRPPRRATRHRVRLRAAARARAPLLGVDQVLRVKRLNLADGEPFAVVTVWCPAELGAAAVARGRRAPPFYELLDVPLRGATQTIGADAAEPPTPSCSASRSAPRCCAASGSRPTPPGARSW